MSSIEQALSAIHTGTMQMPQQVHTAAQAMLPQDWVSVRLLDAQEQLPDGLSLAVILVKDNHDEFALKCLRRTFDAVIYLGALVDHNDQVHQWVEVWSQDILRLEEALNASHTAFTNHQLDQRWQNIAETFQSLTPSGLIATRWQNEPPSPMLLDPKSRQSKPFVHPPSSEAWRLCQDDQWLIQHDLPSYSTSRHRYLYVPEMADESPAWAVTHEAPKNKHVIESQKAIAAEDGLIHWNTYGGPLMVRPFIPLGYEAYVDMLSGCSWSGMLDDHPSLQRSPEAFWLCRHVDEQCHKQGLLLTNRRRRASRIMEVFYLKLRGLTDAMTSVAEWTGFTKSPLLNIQPESFRVSMDTHGGSLPALWNTQVHLTSPGNAFELSIPQVESQYYVPGQDELPSIYWPRSAGRRMEGTCSVLLRNVTIADKGRAVLEGTLRTQQHLSTGENDLIWLAFNIGGVNLELYGTIDSKHAMTSGEYRFKSAPIPCNDADSKKLLGSEGVITGETPFRLIAHFGTPCDLFSLAVLAVRTLLVNEQNNLATALDETLSLAQHLAKNQDDQASLAMRIEAVFADEPRWFETLGPHRLVDQPPEPAKIGKIIPIHLWAKTLALIVKMFPGVGPDSICKTYGLPAGIAMHKVYDTTLAELDELLTLCRCSLFGDWAANEEIRKVIQSIQPTGSNSSEDQ